MELTAQQKMLQEMKQMAIKYNINHFEFDSDRERICIQMHRGGMINKKRNGAYLSDILWLTYCVQRCYELAYPNTEATYKERPLSEEIDDCYKARLKFERQAKKEGKYPESNLGGHDGNN